MNHIDPNPDITYYRLELIVDDGIIYNEIFDDFDYALAKSDAITTEYLLEYPIFDCRISAVTVYETTEDGDMTEEEVVYSNTNEVDYIEVVINTQFGIFSLSDEALKLLREMGNKLALTAPIIFKRDDYIEIASNFNSCWNIKRDDKDLLHVVKCLGVRLASGNFSNLRIVKIPADVDWVITSQSGVEAVEEKHRIWRK